MLENNNKRYSLKNYFCVQKHDCFSRLYVFDVFDVDIDYPKNLHDLHNDLPFLPQKMKINKCDKLICNIYDKNNYVVHISLLKQVLSHGLILKKVHRVISFNQEAWMKDYIITNIEERNKGDSEFKKDF